MHCARWGARHDTSQLLPLWVVLHALWELFIELVIDVLPVSESVVIVELLVTDELLVTIEELFESMELETLAEPLLASTVFPLPSEMYAPAAYAPEAQIASAIAVTKDFIGAPVMLGSLLRRNSASVARIRHMSHVNTCIPRAQIV